jgi:hypothetical protein
MPSPEDIVRGLAQVSNDWKVLAILWHGYFAVVLVAISLGARLSQRVAGIVLILPLVSVSAVAWVAGNPFNGAVFVLGAMALLFVTAGLPRNTITLGSKPWIATGSLLAVFGWCYPHFVESGSYVEYLYAAPLGLVPGPTLSMLAGVTMILRGLESVRWSLVLGILGLFYGVFGALHLGVTIDWILSAGALGLLALALFGMGRAGQAGR